MWRGVFLYASRAQAEEFFRGLRAMFNDPNFTLEGCLQRISYVQADALIRSRRTADFVFSLGVNFFNFFTPIFPRTLSLMWWPAKNGEATITRSTFCSSIKINRGEVQRGLEH